MEVLLIVGTLTYRQPAQLSLITQGTQTTVKCFPVTALSNLSHHAGWLLV